MLSKSFYSLKFASGDLTSAERVLTLYMNIQLPLSQFWSFWGVASGRMEPESPSPSIIAALAGPRMKKGFSFF